VRLDSWPAWRAVLITVVLFAECVDALPLPVLDESDLEHQVAYDEIRRWRSALSVVGVSLTEEEMIALGLSVGATSISFRRWSMAPIRPFNRVFGIGQAWGLFAYPDPYAGRLTVEVSESDGQWREFFRAPDEGTQRWRQVLRYRRIRGVYDDSGDRRRPTALYGRFVDWVAFEIFETYPDVVSVRVRMDLVHIRAPGEDPGDGETHRHTVVRNRASLSGVLEQRWNRR